MENLSERRLSFPLPPTSVSPQTAFLNHLIKRSSSLTTETPQIHLSTQSATHEHKPHETLITYNPYTDLLNQHRPLKPTTKYPELTTTELIACQEKGMHHYANMLADSTWDNIASTIAQYEEFCTTYNLTIATFQSIVTWIGFKMLKHQLQPQSAVTYLSYLRSHLKRIGIHEPDLHLQLGQLQQGISKTPTEKHPAPPVPIALLLTLRGMTATAAVIAFRLAARIDELRVLTPKHITLLRKDHLGFLVMIDFKQDTKTSKNFRASANIRFSNLLYLENMPPMTEPERPLFSLPIINQLLKNLELWEYSGHSIKKLAADIIVKQVETKHLPIHVIPLALKHTTSLDKLILPSVTMGYLSPQSKAVLLENIGMRTLAQYLFEISSSHTRPN